MIPECLETLSHFNRQRIAPLIIRMPGVPLDPDERHLMHLEKTKQPLPKIRIESRSLIRFHPPARPPSIHPSLSYRINHILRIRSQRHLARLLQRLKRTYRAQQLHSVISSPLLAARKLLLSLLIDNYRAPTARTRIMLTGSVRVNINVLHIPSLCRGGDAFEKAPPPLHPSFSKLLYIKENST